MQEEKRCKKQRAALLFLEWMDRLADVGLVVPKIFFLRSAEPAGLDSTVYQLPSSRSLIFQIDGVCGRFYRDMEPEDRERTHPSNKAVAVTTLSIDT